MLMAVKNQMRVCALAVKYNIMREMLNKVTFFDEYSVYDVQQCDFYRAVGDLAAAEGGCRRLYDA